MSDLFKNPPDWLLELGRFDRPWNPCEIDYDTIAHEDGPGPWIILKGRWDESPDPSSVLPIDAGPDRLADALRHLRQVELQDISPDSPWRNERLPSLLEGKPLVPGVVVFVGSDAYLHRHMVSRMPDLVLWLPDEGACDAAALRIAEASRRQ